MHDIFTAWRFGISPGRKVVLCGMLGIGDRDLRIVKIGEHDHTDGRIAKSSYVAGWECCVPSWFLCWDGDGNGLCTLSLGGEGLQ